PTPAPTPVVLTASYQGVTETEIAIGAAVIDLEQLASFGIDLSPFPFEGFYQALADDLNQRGGINGRNVVVHLSLFLPFGEADNERVCTELMEDKKVFVVTGQFLEDGPLCITELHGHPYVGHFGENTERQARSNGLFFATEMNQNHIRVAAVTEMIRAGDLDGFNVGIFHGPPTEKEYADTVEPLLTDAGISVTGVYTSGPFLNDTLADQQAGDNVARRMEADGVDLILNVATGAYGIIGSVQRIGWEVPIAQTSGQASDRLTLADDLSLSDEVLARTFAVTIHNPSPEELLADPGVQQCIAVYEELHGDEPLDLTDDEVVGTAAGHCAAFALTVKILEAAGGNITPETFVAAAEGLGTFDLPGLMGASLSPDKHSVGTLMRRYEYSPEARTWLPVGDPFQYVHGE
ncbi:MAG: ABC transporter substrate-binding protein, partial [Acidimicrobiia bacterium]|nr:ABC transporter substrate-binding protein [Acidimicrobiia bacterium]